MLEFNGTGIIIAISFIIFVIIENFIFYAPMRKTLEDRADYIANNEKDAHKNTSDANSLVEDKNQKISNAKKESSQIINDKSLKIKETYSNSIREEKANSNAKLEELKNNLKAEKENAQNVLKAQIGSFASAIVSKVLKKDVSLVNINEELVEKALRGEL